MMSRNIVMKSGGVRAAISLTRLTGNGRRSSGTVSVLGKVKLGGTFRKELSPNGGNSHRMIAGGGKVAFLPAENLKVRRHPSTRLNEKRFLTITHAITLTKA
jgi:hypothetical protein